MSSRISNYKDEIHKLKHSNKDKYRKSRTKNGKETDNQLDDPVFKKFNKQLLQYNLKGTMFK
jgi:hypothetical protein